MRRVSEVQAKTLPKSLRAFTTKRQARVVVLDPHDPDDGVRPYDTEWSGGTRNEYTFVELPDPRNPAAVVGHEFVNGKYVPSGRVVLVEHGHFCGRVRQITVYLAAEAVPLYAAACPDVPAPPREFWDVCRVMSAEVVKDWCETTGLHALSERMSALLWPKVSRQEREFQTRCPMFMCPSSFNTYPTLGAAESGRRPGDTTFRVTPPGSPGTTVYVNVRPARPAAGGVALVAETDGRRESPGG